jgi:hypothetical protein
MAQNNRGSRPNQHLRQKLATRHQEHREERLGKEQERFTAPPTPRQARNEARNYAAREVNPTIHNFRSEMAGSAARQRQDTQWYNKLAENQTQAAAGAETAANTFASTLTQQLAAANNTNAQYLAQQQAAAQGQAALTGVPLSASSGQAAAAGADVNAANAVVQNMPTLGSAYREPTYLRRQGIADQEQGHVAAGQQIQARKALRQGLVEAQKQKGQAYVGKVGELKESARKQALDKQALEVEGQQNAAKEALEQQKLQQAERQNRRGAAVTKAGQAVTAADSAASTAASTTSAEASARNAAIAAQKFKSEQRYKHHHNGMTPAEVASRRKENTPSLSEKAGKKEDVQDARAAAQTAIQALGKSPSQYTPEEWLYLEKHLVAPKTGKEPGADIPPAVAAKVVAELREKAERNKPVVEAASNLKPGF